MVAGVTITVQALLPPSVPKDVICAAVGYDRHLSVALPQPWRSQRVTDSELVVLDELPNSDVLEARAL